MCMLEQPQRREEGEIVLEPVEFPDTTQAKEEARTTTTVK